MSHHAPVSHLAFRSGSYPSTVSKTSCTVSRRCGSRRYAVTMALRSVWYAWRGGCACVRVCVCVRERERECVCVCVARVCYCRNNAMARARVVPHTRLDGDTRHAAEELGQGFLLVAVDLRVQGWV